MRRGMSYVSHTIHDLMVLQDCVLAAEAGVDGVLLSNHGGEQGILYLTVD